MLSLDHKNHGPGVLGALKLGGQPVSETTQVEGGNRMYTDKETGKEVDSMSAKFPLDYHLGTSRVFVPCALPARTHNGPYPRPSATLLPSCCH